MSTTRFSRVKSVASENPRIDRKGTGCGQKAFFQDRYAPVRCMTAYNSGVCVAGRIFQGGCPEEWLDELNELIAVC